MIYFDNNATLKTNRRAFKNASKVFNKNWYNCSSLYKSGRKAYEALNRARQEIAKVLGCDDDEIFFTSGASESIAWVSKMRNVIYLNNVHSTIRESIKDCNPKLINKFIVALSYIDNETGHFYEEYTNDEKKLKNKLDCNFFVDLTSSGNKIIFSNLHKRKNTEYACLSGHKFGSVPGIGLLYIKKDIQKYIQPLIYGSQENGFRGGTENLFGAVNLAECLKDIKRNYTKYMKKVDKITNYICNNINHKLIKNINFSNNVINITFNNLNAQTAVQLFDKYNICISAGSACNSSVDEASFILLARNYSVDDASKTIRISISRNNSIKEAKKFIKVLNKIIKDYDNNIDNQYD